MKQFLSNLPRNIIGCFEGRMFTWHVVAIVLTFILVTSGFDWLYFTFTHSPILRSWMFPAAPIGGLVPIVLPLILIAVGSLNQNAKTLIAIRYVDTAAGKNGVPGQADGSVWEGGEPFYGTRSGPGWYQGGTRVPRG